MNTKKLNTSTEFEFCDGTKTELTLAFYALYQLRAKNKSLYERYNKIMNNKNPEELEMVTILYTAYVCAHLEEEVMSEEEFFMACGSDRIALRNALEVLTNPKKTKASANPS
jgi:hypothetical protein